MGEKSLFCCPVCMTPLTHDAHTYTCPHGHSFDRSREGYTHLLPANRKHAKEPGDDREMVRARNAFLSKGYYRALRDTLCELARAETILDAGCGEGYYTEGIWEACHPRLAGVDLSKPALKYAAKRVPEAEFAVASVFHLPVATGAIDLLLNVFAPLAIEEYRRVLRPGGKFLYVVPSRRHLWQMKEILYPAPYENEVKRTPYPGFSYLDVVSVTDTITLENQEDIQSLFAMTPYRWKTPKDGAERLAQTDRLTTEIAFDIHSFQMI